jgi:hypothetical protein
MSSKKIGKMVGADVDKALANISASTPKPDMKADDTIKKATGPQKAQTFSEAFKAARADKGAGKTFTWGGKSYSTNKAGEGAKKTSGRSGTAAPATAAPKTAAPKTAAPKASTPAPKASTPAPKAATPTPTPTVNPAFFKKKEGAPTGAAGVKTPAPKPDTSKADAKKRVQDYASRMQQEAVKKRKEESAPTGRNVGAKLANMLGFGSENAARQARYIRQREALQSRNKPLLLVGDEAREANRRQGTIGGMKKGGSVDGIAIRGKTRAPMKKGK